MSGTGYRIRYDKDLGNLGPPKVYRVTGWAELFTPDERHSFAGYKQDVDVIEIPEVPELSVPL